MHTFMSIYAAGPGKIGDVLPQKPGWGPFGAIGSTAAILIAAIWAAGLAFVAAKTIWGASQQHIGGKRGYTEQTEHGKEMFRSGLTGILILGSITTLITIVYALSI